MSAIQASADACHQLSIVNIISKDVFRLVPEEFCFKLAPMIGIAPVYFFEHATKFGRHNHFSPSAKLAMVCTALLLGGVSLASKYASRVALFCVLLGSTFPAFL
jgi:hypothetical protein